jgi:hypothetical protein
VKKVKFVVVLADVDKAAVFVYDARLEDLMDVNYLARVESGVYYAYREMPWDNPSSGADFYNTVSGVVDNVVSRYAQYAPVVRLLK